MVLGQKKMTNHRFQLGNRGNAFIEDFVLAMVVLLATVAFYGGGNFNGVRGKIENAFSGAEAEVLKE